MKNPIFVTAWRGKAGQGGARKPKKAPFGVAREGVKDRRMINGLALCAGAGGLELGLHLAIKNYRTVCAVERQAYAAACFISWMEAAGMGACPVWDDLSTFDPLSWRECVDIVSAGFPCQPYSNAGKGLGELDTRDGWPHVIRIVRGIMPAVVFLENVPALLARGYDRVKRNLEGIGYTVAERIVSAAECGAPHLRERLFILGVLADTAWFERNQRWTEPDQIRHPITSGCGSSFERLRSQMGDANGTRLQDWRAEWPTIDGCAEWPWPSGRKAEQHSWEQPRLVKSGVGRTAYGLDTRNEQLLCLGNGVVPVAAAMAFVALWCEVNNA